MAIRETPRPSSASPSPARPGATARPNTTAARDERARQAQTVESLEPHWAQAIDAATD
jgi:hypothetical protein